jgi:hypothetical protein
MATAFCGNHHIYLSMCDLRAVDPHIYVMLFKDLKCFVPKCFEHILQLLLNVIVSYRFPMLCFPLALFFTHVIVSYSLGRKHTNHLGELLRRIQWGHPMAQRMTFPQFLQYIVDGQIYDIWNIYGIMECNNVFH